ncbi:ABC transporter [Advenella kashmirensis W13003]|uniref:ABC transporter n=1 Tax=Advenella kashmirensis W13003 TaxID=1424334 RepID=V8QPR6_9BURK|nr:ABC transporter substrate-binding protein [Advenella kashmirensis]ETF01333.1 ABC transporter [Advenella kashmirensis W13003]
MKINTTRMLLSALFSTLAATAHAAGTLVYCFEGSPAGFDSAQYTAVTDFNATAGIFESLTAFKRGSTELVPALAEKWDISEDGLVYTFHLRPGVKFHKTRFFTPTRDLNADDVVYTFHRMMDKNHPFRKAYPSDFPYFTDMNMHKNLKSVEKVDDKTVRFTLNEVDASFLQSMAMMFASIYSKEYMEKLLADGKPELLNQQPLGTGPFVFERYQKDAQIRYKANKDYWDKDNGPLLDNLIYAINKDAAVRAQKLKANECQVMTVPSPMDVERMKADPDLKVLSRPGFQVGYLHYNTEKELLKKKEVRQALDMALNKEIIIKAVYGGQAKVAHNVIPESQWSYDETIRNRPQDVEKAKALLAQAGYPNGFEIRLWYSPLLPNGRLMAEMIQADWEKIGVKSKITTFEWGEYLKRGQKGEHDAIAVGWIGDNGDPDNWFGNVLSCHAIGGSNYSRFCYQPMQELVVKAKRVTDKEERVRIYKEVQKIVHEYMPVSPMSSPIVNVPMRKNVEGFMISPFGRLQFNGVSLK